MKSLDDRVVVQDDGRPSAPDRRVRGGDPSRQVEPVFLPVAGKVLTTIQKGAMVKPASAARRRSLESMAFKRATASSRPTGSKWCRQFSCIRTSLFLRSLATPWFSNTTLARTLLPPMSTVSSAS